ncbi:hypothetical protein GCWU000282_02284 [Catonella morbi ATCC 51271]|uniref:YCII-related domain-containing protein n=1 Tax=Catonella morbi ATCC 51271 TaxID=592026 RepID=V2Z5G3_9FIRM|nr:YciI family protein [Catonella morbi]ESL02150.1 hypothetical protein GCWU000282_02284 [Catonella morbi ATCC 51271]
MAYVYLMDNKKILNMEIVKRHVGYLKELDDLGKLILCGPFTDYDGGIVILECRDIEEARAIAESDPFIKDGYKTFELRTLNIANKDNNYGI